MLNKIKEFIFGKSIKKSIDIENITQYKKDFPLDNLTDFVISNKLKSKYSVRNY
jgi:hypothetical protein